MTYETAWMVGSVALFVAMLVTMARLFIGPSLYDRVLAVNSFGTKTVVLLAILNYMMGRPDFIDIALLYALLNFVGTIAVLKFFRYRKFHLALSQINADADPEGLIDPFARASESVKGDGP